MVEPISTTIIVGYAVKGVASAIAGKITEEGINCVSSSINAPNLPQKIKDDKRYREAMIGYAKRNLALKEQELNAREEFSQNLLNLLGEWQVRQSENKLREIQIDWDKDKWFSNLDRYETEKILGQQQHRLLMLASMPNISPDCPKSFEHNLHMEIHNNTSAFLSHFYPLNSALSPVDFYGDYFKMSISRVDVKRLQAVLGSIPVAVLYSEVTDYQVNFHLGLWGMETDNVTEVSLLPWNWEDAYDSLIEQGKREKQAQRIIRQIIVAVHQLLAGFAADWYYLNINPLYQPRLFELAEAFPEDWIKPCMDILQQGYNRNQVTMKALSYYQQGLSLWQAKRYQDAVTNFEQSLALQPSSEEAWYYQGLAMSKLEKWEEAKACFDQATEINPDYQEAWQARGEVLLKLALQKFSFEIVIVNAHGKEINRTTKEALYYEENLGNGVSLEIVSIQGGSFLMGLPETEIEQQTVYTDSRIPQHRVTISPFYMGKYPITQAQWRVIASLPKVYRELELNPSCFKGDNLPVEGVNHFDAEEFCCRLSRHTRRRYKLPSEAEWEYACRAGTTTPFYFGETITSDLVNYNGNYVSPSELYREKTTPVGQFLPNAFGLYDMHGNVWEWCADCWHDDYKDAPIDGSTWIVKGLYYEAVLRGGSWSDNRYLCRSDYRNHEITGCCSNYKFGFRVAGMSPSTS